MNVLSNAYSILIIFLLVILIAVGVYSKNPISSLKNDRCKNTESNVVMVYGKTYSCNKDTK